MTTKSHDSDATMDAARDATAGHDALPADLEAAWAEWSKGNQDMDERTLTLLRAAFDAGAEAGATASAAELGRRGGRKGGQARARKLTNEQRSDIARKAAATRWSKDRR